MSIKDTVEALSAIERTDSIIAIDMDMAGTWHIHMVLERFIELFDEWSTTEQSERCKRLSVDCAGVEVFALRRIV